MIESIVEERSIETNLNEQQKNFIAYFYKYGFVGIMLDWIEKGMDENYNEIVDDLEKTVHGTIDLSIKNFTDNKKW